MGIWKTQNLIFFEIISAKIQNEVGFGSVCGTKYFLSYFVLDFENKFAFFLLVGSIIGETSAFLNVSRDLTHILTSKKYHRSRGTAEISISIKKWHRELFDNLL